MNGKFVLILIVFVFIVVLLVLKWQPFASGTHIASNGSSAVRNISSSGTTSGKSESSYVFAFVNSKLNSSNPSYVVAVSPNEFNVTAGSEINITLSFEIFPSGSFTVDNVTVLTPNFSLLKVYQALPVEVNTTHGAQIKLGLMTPKTSFYGYLNLLVYISSLKPEVLGAGCTKYMST